jgi:PAS domain S-box-containing protein
LTEDRRENADTSTIEEARVASQPIQKKDSVVLVVDDSETMRMLMREALEQANFVVEEAEDGKAALACFPTLKPDLVLLDVMMPGMDGFEVCTAIRQLLDGERTPILMVTGLDDIESITRAYEVGATDFVTKPINWVILQHRLRYMQKANLAIDELYRSKETLREAHRALAFRIEERTAELQQSEERYRTLAENIQDLLCELDADSKLVYLSPNYPDTLGYQPPELLGRHVFDIVHPADIQDVRARLHKGGSKVIFRARHKNGSWRWFESTIKSYTTAQGQFRAVAVSRDITDRRKAEEELALRDRAISSTSEGVCITDPHQPGNPLIYVNAGFERLTGYTRDEVLGKTCSFLQGQHTGQETIAKIRAAIREERECVAELLNYRKDGAPFWNRLAITPVRNTNGQVTHFLGIQSDITERKEMERMKDELVSTVSHELRTPLTSLRGFAELMLKRNFPMEKQREFLRIIHNESMRLTELINDFLDLQRIEAGRQVYHFEDVVIGFLLQDVLSVFDLENGKHKLRLDVPAWLPVVHIDTARIRQVITNLLSNAIKFSPQGGQVTVGAGLEGDAVKVWVADQGVGIPPDALPNLFSKFFRVDNRDTRSIGGTGLGLALVKEIIKAHGGRVWVESVVGKGSTFCFTLPLSSAEHGSRAVAVDQSDTSEKLL